jgi:hypothetical protein
MTSPRPERSARSTLRRLPGGGRAAIALGLIAAASPALSGCGEEPPPPPVVQAPAPPPPPPPPPLTTIAELMERFGFDGRIRLREEQAPGSDPARIAVLRFFDAFLRGQETAVRAMLSIPDQLQLDELVASGEWAASLEGVTRVDVRCGRSPQGDDAVLAIFHVGTEFQPQLWLMELRGEEGTFDAVPTPPDIMNRLSGTDWIAAWFKVNQEEMARADQLDEVVVIPQRDLGDESGSSRASSGGMPSLAPAGGGGGGGGPGRRRPSTPIPPPGGMP